ncbi:hypothetical protein TIFTF001_021891 [Ficus carica]|uniref:Uncharacterized protein n=1 Tax=Ficus carica TaxID=3494 RepID=A0AA88AGS0_FICCA|nr:hypothetical protein TIFTF001_021891 [Ficus carica]
MQWLVLCLAQAPHFDLILGPAQAPPFGQCQVVGPYSVVREPQELGSLQGQILGPARAPFFDQCSIMGPYSVVQEPQELGQGQILSWVLLGHLLSSVPGRGTLLCGPRTTGVGGSARADLGSCSSTSFRSVSGRETLFHGPRTAEVGGSARADLILGPAQAPPFGQCPVMGP